MRNAIRLRAFAKVNLGLKILEKRSDGYHEIRTITQALSLHDRLEVRLVRSHSSGQSLGQSRGKFRGVIVDCDDAEVPSGLDNLVFKACDLWRRARRFKGGIQVRLEKRIPMGSGLGGGSSDAAAAILGLERLTGDHLDNGARWELAASLGSDVPLFLVGGRVFGFGRGEEVVPLPDLPRRRCLVVFPGFSMPTAAAYREADLSLTKRRRNPNMKTFGAWPHISSDDWGSAENDFEQVVFARWPELGRLKAQLIQAGAEIASLTGSGSAVFAVFESGRDLVRASKVIPPGWQTFRARTLARSEYRRLVFA